MKKLLILFSGAQPEKLEIHLKEKYEVISVSYLDFSYDTITASSFDLILIIKCAMQIDSAVLAGIVEHCRINNKPVISLVNDISEKIINLDKNIFNTVTAPIEVISFSRMIDKFLSEDYHADKKKILFCGGDNSLDKDLSKDDLLSMIISGNCDITSKNLIIKKLLSKYSKNHSTTEKDYYSSQNIENVEMTNDIYKSIKEKNFKLFYQPVINMRTDCISGFESLIRWFHPEKGMIPPDKFIKVAETSDVIIPLSEWVIDEGMRQIEQWYKKFDIKDSGVRVNINLSAKQFVIDNLAEIISGINQKYDVQPESIGFEITESSFMEDMNKANMTFLKMKSMKYHLYLDDFGTGYSSLSYLSHFPVDVLKIDQSFIKWLHVDEDSSHIVKSIIGLAHGLNLKVVAEGIEEKEHVDFLKLADVDYGQGYIYSKPLPPEDAENYLHKFCNYK